MIPENRHRKIARIHKAREVYKGRIFSFVIENVSLPNDRRAEMAFVRHPGSTAIVPLLDEALGMIEIGRITDALTILALQWAYFYLKKQ